MQKGSIELEDQQEDGFKLIPIRFTSNELIKLGKILKQYPNMTRTALIKHRIFNFRNRSKLKMNSVDLIFLGTLANSISCLLSDARRGVDIVPHANDLQKMINEKLGQ